MIRIEILIKDVPGTGGSISSKAYASASASTREHELASSIFKKFGLVTEEIAGRPEMAHVAMVERVIPL